MATAPRQGLNAFIHGFLCGPKNLLYLCRSSEAGLIVLARALAWVGRVSGVCVSVCLSLSLSVRLLAVSELSAEGTADSDVAASCSSSPDAQDFESEVRTSRLQDVRMFPSTFRDRVCGWRLAIARH